jgi:serine/threonine protein kinase
VKIADFGLAKFIMKYNLYRRTPTVVTLSYRAPEVLFTKGNYDFKIDIWSLGCFAFELAFGYTIFNGRNEQEHVKQMVEICGTPQEDTWPGITSNEVFQASCP